MQHPQKLHITVTTVNDASVLVSSILILILNWIDYGIFFWGGGRVIQQRVYLLKTLLH